MHTTYIHTSKCKEEEEEERGGDGDGDGNGTDVPIGLQRRTDVNRHFVHTRDKAHCSGERVLSYSSRTRPIFAECVYVLFIGS